MDFPSDFKLVYSTDPQQKLTEQQSSLSGQRLMVLCVFTDKQKVKKAKAFLSLQVSILRRDALKALCSDLKKHCGCGRKVADFDIELQTQDRRNFKAFLTQRDFRVKLAGG